MKHGEAESGILKLAPLPRDTGDRIYRIQCDGGHAIGWTKRSRRHAADDLSQNLEGLMIRQLQVTKPFWRELTGCTKGRPEYLELRAHLNCVPEAEPQPKKRRKGRAQARRRSK